jgi:hypothetical protein
MASSSSGVWRRVGAWNRKKWIELSISRFAQQAQFAVDLQQSRELSDRRHLQVTEALMRLTVVVADLGTAQTRSERRYEELAAAQKETQANLSTLMRIVEKYFRDRTNGGLH